MEVTDAGVDKEDIDGNEEFELADKEEDIGEGSALGFSDEIGVDDGIEVGGNNELGGVVELLSSRELEDTPELDNMMELDIASWPEESGELDGLAELETGVRFD